ncbi:MAG: hypothetical protein RLP44_20955 [Aggregatilineales bacterium]
MIDYERYLTKVQKLMREKNYAEARRILVLLDHPTAHLWLARLDEIQSEMGRDKRKSSSEMRSRRWSRSFKMILIVMVMWLMINLLALSVMWINPKKPLWLHSPRQLTATRITSINNTVVAPLLVTETVAPLTAIAETATQSANATETP